MEARNKFVSLTLLAFKREIIKKLVFSRPKDSEVTKISARVCAHRGRRILAMEYFLPGNTVSQKNIPEDEVEKTITELLSAYGQANLITTLGDAEWKISKSGKEVALGADSLERKLSSDTPAFVKAIADLDKKKNYLLSGSEAFLTALGISDKNGRVHDKKQGKFRQINRFLEHIENFYDKLSREGEIVIYDLCCGKSYLSFAVYYYLTEVKGRKVSLLGIDLKRDVIEWCASLASELSYSGMKFVYDDVRNTPRGVTPDMVISLHACDIATDIVINRAIELNAKIILSTPCCHKYLNDKISAESLSFVTEHPHLKGKLCEAITDAIRTARISAAGYKVSALELTDPENTPKNTLIAAIKTEGVKETELARRRERYDAILDFVLGDKKDSYLSEIK